jgi:hypothetical protein
VDELVKIYNETLPELPEARATEILSDEELTTKLAEVIRQNPDPTTWRDLFVDVRDVPSYMGDNQIRWQADLPWLLRNINRVMKRVNAPRPGDSHKPRYLD